MACGNGYKAVKAAPSAKLALGAALFFLSSVASAFQLEGIRFPERVRIGAGGPELVLNGAGVREQAIFKVYVSALYLPSRCDDGDAILSLDQPRRLALHFLRNVSTRQLIASTNDALRNTLTNEEREPLASRLTRLNEFLETLPDLKDGTAIMIDYVPKNGTTIRVGSGAQHRIPGADFNQALMRVWLGDRPNDPQLKKAMLGLN